MRIFEGKRVACLMLVGLCSGSAVRAFANDDGKDKPLAKPAVEVKSDALSSRPNQTTSSNADSTRLGAAPKDCGTA